MEPGVQVVVAESANGYEPCSGAENDQIGGSWPAEWTPSTPFRVRRGRVRSIERFMIANRASNHTVLGPKRDYLELARIPVQN